MDYMVSGYLVLKHGEQALSFCCTTWKKVPWIFVYRFNCEHIF